ncbi:MAG: sialate O-acetylesterase [Algibacter sp.]|uniref:sialate O-acetylesterase n=1 Tax=Algibacter sp. TaxID=1872428 RepID=UPI0032974ECD
MKKKYFLFQLALVFSLLFVGASNHMPTNDYLKTKSINSIEDVFNTSNIQVSEDTYVRAGSSANDNFGISPELNIKSTTNNDFVRESLMKFDLSAYETITSAKIFFYAKAQVAMDVNAYSVDTDTWSENSVTWNNAPLFNTNIGAIGLTTSYSWVELDVTSAVTNDFSSSDKTFSIGLKDDNTIKKTVFIYSKENSAQYIPYIQIEGTLTSNGGGDVAVTGVSVSPTSATIDINGTQQLLATISPSNASNQTVSWSSSNNSIASVNSTGLVTGVSAGVTTVTVTTEDGNKTSSMTLTVNEGTNPQRDVFLVIGQSNTAGRGAIEAEDMVALNGVDLFNGSTWETAVNTNDIHPTTGAGLGGLNRYSTIYNENQTQGLNFSYTFGRTLNEQTGNQIGLVVNARGGTNINDWAKGASAGYYAAAISQINLALAIPNTTLKGILWHQGESNRNDSNYLTKLSNLISDLRSDLGISDLPFIAGQLSMERTDNETFNANIETLPSLVNNTDYAESDSLQTTDLTHFDSAAQRILGERYASKILQLVYNTNPSIECIADISQTNDAGADGAIVTYETPVGTDNSPGATTVQTEGLASGELFPIGTTTNTFVVTDVEGNTASCSFNVIVTEEANTCNVLIDENNFNSSWGIWNDGGSDCRRSSNDALFSNGGTGSSVRLRDNTSTSVTTTDALNLSTYTEITIDFNFIADQVEAGEDFWLQISTDGGGSFETVGDWDANDEFVNGTRYFESITIQGPFPTNTYLRFKMDASANSDLIYIDDVKITGCSSSTPASKNTATKKETAVTVDEPVKVTTNLFFTNPVENELVIKSNLIINNVSLFSLTGVHLRTESINKTASKLNVSNLQSGTYVLVIQNGNKATTKLLVKK